MKTPLIFDIQRSSYVDGPGVRTAVFFKGCNLKCRWCHNPESQHSDFEFMVFPNKCTKCGHCKEVCPEKGKTCTHCGRCALLCPNDALKLCGEEYTVEKLMDTILLDKPYYANSNGGVTLSGGECLLYPEFSMEVLKACKENGIHTAVDTAGNLPWASFERVLPYTDLFLYDIKCFSATLHKEGTGVSNELILDNLIRLSAETDKGIWVRVPLVPGFNDSDDELGKIGEFLRPLRLSKVEVLPYHKMGEHKYVSLGKDPESFEVPGSELIARAKALIGSN